MAWEINELQRYARSLTLFVKIVTYCGVFINFEIKDRALFFGVKMTLIRE